GDPEIAEAPAGGGDRPCRHDRWYEPRVPELGVGDGADHQEGEREEEEGGEAGDAEEDGRRHHPASPGDRHPLERLLPRRDVEPCEAEDPAGEVKNPRQPEGGSEGGDGEEGRSRSEGYDVRQGVDRGPQGAVSQPPGEEAI